MVSNLADASSNDLKNRARSVTETARDWLAAHREVALATVMSTWGSSPVPAGAQLVVSPDQRFEGSVSGGCVEAAVVTATTDVLKARLPRIMRFGVSDNQALDAGLPCGGEVELLIEALNADDHLGRLSEIASAETERRMVVIATNLQDGTRRLISNVAMLPEPARNSCLAGNPHKEIEENADTPTLFYKPYVPSLRLIVVGAGQIAQILSRLATAAEIDVIVVDPRTAFATEERFQGITLNCQWPGTGLQQIGLDDHSAVAVVSHQAQIDDEALTTALASNVFYIGALGSRRTHSSRLERLQQAGIAESDLNRIDAPIGLDIGARGPAEIAVSILSGVIAARRRYSG